jgi:hypothetical protein
MKQPRTPPKYGPWKSAASIPQMTETPWLSHSRTPYSPRNPMTMRTATFAPGQGPRGCVSPPIDPSK